MGRSLAAQALMDSDSVIEGCRRGDREAFRELFETYKDRVYSIALHYFSGNEAAAHDITQQVFLKLITGIGQFRSASEFSTWLYRLVVNACIDRQRSNRRWIVLDTVAEVGRRWAGRTQEEQYLDREQAGAVRSAVAALRPKIRMAVLLRYFDELSYEEIAAILGCSIGTVASRLNRGHKTLARELAHLRPVPSPQGSRNKGE